MLGNKENLSISISSTIYITDDIHNQKKSRRNRGNQGFIYIILIS